MQWSEVGEVQAYLLRHRVVESHPQRRRRAGEERIAALLKRAENTEAMLALQQIFEGQGLELIRYDSADMPGIFQGGEIWLLARHPDQNPPQYFAREYVLDQLNLRQQESQAAAGVWFLHIWLMYLGLVYTYTNRGISEISRYQDARFPYSRLVSAVRDHCEGLRSTRIDDANARGVVEILTDTQGSDLERRVAAFCRLMVESGLIERVDAEGEDDAVYCQTLLGAVEVARNYESGMGLLDPGDDALAQIANVAADRRAAEDDEGEAD